MHNFYLNDLTSSISSFIAVNFDTNVEIFTKFGFLELNMIGALVIK